ncbi:MAG: hypothetical protein V1897_15795, partial [Pseudomonadota bacterium]
FSPCEAKDMKTALSSIGVWTLTILLLIGWLFPGTAQAGPDLLQGPVLRNPEGNSFSNCETKPLSGFIEKPSVYIGYMGSDRGLRAGYDGLVRPGTCVSSYFEYNLRGISLSGSIPLQLTREMSAKFEGLYLFTMASDADQDITWLTMPPGTRHWDWTRSCFYNLQGELIYQIDNTFSFIAGFRWESLATTFGNPNPDYPFTVPYMESGLSVEIYQPFVGFSAKQSLGNGGQALFQLIGFPAMLASLQHFNTCNNAGTPFAHVGNQTIGNGYFIEIKGEFGLTTSLGIDAAAFLTWDLFSGSCIMNLERRDGANPPSVTAADVDFSYYRSSVTLGGKFVVPFSTPF